MAKPDDVVVRLYLEETGNPKKIAEAAGKLPGVLAYKIVPEDEELDWMLREVGRRINQMENWEDLDCPLRSLRDDIEEFLDEDLRMPYDANKTLRRS